MTADELLQRYATAIHEITGTEDSAESSLADHVLDRIAVGKRGADDGPLLTQLSSPSRTASTI